MRARGLAVLFLLAGCSKPSGAPSPLDAGMGPGSWTGARFLPQERFEGYAIALGGKIYYLGGISDLCTMAPTRA